MKQWLELQAELGGYEVYFDESWQNFTTKTGSLPPASPGKTVTKTSPIPSLPAQENRPKAATASPLPKAKTTAPLPAETDIYSLQNWNSSPSKPSTQLEGIADLSALHEYSQELPIYRSPAGDIKHYLLGEGKTQKPAWMVVGLLPSPTEDSMRCFLPGMEGELLRRLLEALGIQFNLCYCTWFCKKFRALPIMPRDRTTFRKLLQREAEIVEPRSILLLGETTLQYVLDCGDSLANTAGNKREFAGLPTTALHHPSDMLQNPELKRITWNEHVPRSPLFGRRT